MIPSILLWLYRTGLRAFPVGFRAEFEEEMVDVFRRRLDSAAAEGYPAMLALLLREIGGLAAGGTRRRLYARRRPTLLAQTGGAGVLVDDRPSRRFSPLKIFLIAAGLVLFVFLAYWVYIIYAFTRPGAWDRPPRVQDVALGDVNGDGLVDVYLAAAPDGEPFLHPDYLLLNEGNGRFRDSEMDFGDRPTFSATLVDVNGDGHSDLVVGQYGARVYLNDGRGRFASHAILSVPDGVNRTSVAVADLDDDGRPDIFGAGCCGSVALHSRTDQRPLLPGSQVWLNNGEKPYFHRGAVVGHVGSHAVALADLNGDGTIDAFLANGTTLAVNGSAIAPTATGRVIPGGAQQHAAEVEFERDTPDTVWFNDGQGNFTDSGQQLGTSEGLAVALGDVNGDGFPDAVVGVRGPDEIWLNDGRGVFSDSGQRLGGGPTRSVFLADLDGDGDLDLVTGGEEAARIWFNDGSGVFTAGDRAIDYSPYEAIALGDVTGDDIPDIFVAGVGTYQLWRGQGDGRFIADPRGSYEVTYNAGQ